MSDTAIANFYAEIYADLSVDREEAAELYDFLRKLNPPPDKLTKLRATAFKAACSHLSDDKDSNVSLLRTINYIVHAFEDVCLDPKELDETTDLDEEALGDFYKTIFEDLSVDQEENTELFQYFKSNAPPPDSLVAARALAFKIGCDYLSEDTDANVQLLRCINCIVHAFELCCYQPKPYELADEQVDPSSMELPEAVQHLWDLDVNRLTPGEDYVVNVQKGKKPFWKEDAARDPLFTSVDRNVWKRPTYSAFRNLLDNYIAETGRAENVTNTERAEIRTFLRAIMQTAPMQFCHRYCHAKKPDEVPADRDGFVEKLHEIWFELYRRAGSLDSSGFEHVFIGEVKNGDVSGFHNWIQFYLEELKGDLDYRGYIKPRGNNQPHHDENDHLLTLQFSWHGVEKFVGTSFVGVSPEFEMALYTLCFLVGEQENFVDLDTGDDVFGLVIKCYSMSRGKIGTTFPEVKSHYEE